MYINTYSNHYQQTIDHFHGAYAFLSNFYPSRIYYRGYWYANNEAAFQAQKTISPKEQLQFTKLRNPKDAKKLGREVQLRSDWESVKLMYMTANAFDEDKKKALACGMNGFLSKPIVIEELISTLQNSLG